MGGFTLLMTGFWAEAEAELEAEVEAGFWAEMGAAPAPTSAPSENMCGGKEKEAVTHEVSRK